MSRPNYLTGMSGSADPIPDRRFAVVPPTAQEAEGAPARRRRRYRKPGARRVPRWPAPPALQPVPWGKPDEILGRALCAYLAATMPGPRWHYTSEHPARAVGGWIALAFVALAILAGASR